MNCYNIAVRDFGKIRDASVNPSKMMMFIGDNNSGKSYLMQLIWGLFNSSDALFDGTFESQEYDACRQKILSIILDSEGLVKTENATYKLCAEDINELLKYVNFAINKNINFLVQKILNSNDIKAGSLEIVDFIAMQDYEIKVNFDSSENVIMSIGSNQTYSYRMTKPDSGEVFKYDPLIRVFVKLCAYLIIVDGFSSPFSDIGKGNTSIKFLPASRTGFVLTYKDLVRSALDSVQAISNQGDVTDVTTSVFSLPINLFVKDIATYEASADGRFEEIVNYIEDHIFEGHLLPPNSENKSVRYIPKGMKKELNVHLTSSMITELAPLIMTLKAKTAFSTIIIEEPEAHLHIKAQRILTKALVMLKNEGINVWLTTHSDTIAQELTNLIKANSIKNKDKVKKNGVLSSQFTSHSDVSAYQFSIVNRKTDVAKLEVNEAGISVPSFTEELTKQLMLEASLDEEFYSEVNGVEA